MLRFCCEGLGSRGRGSEIRKEEGEEEKGKKEVGTPKRHIEKRKSSVRTHRHPFHRANNNGRHSAKRNVNITMASQHRTYHRIPFGRLTTLPRVKDGMGDGEAYTRELLQLYTNLGHIA